MKKIICYFLLSLLAATMVLAESCIEKSRLLVLTDIEADPDDAQSLVRLLLYSNEVDIEGLVATTSTHMRHRISPESIRTILDAYGQVHPNLLKHDDAYPSHDFLLSKVREGQPIYGFAAVGEGKDSDGSELIIELLKKKDERPLWISVWGGANTLAQALYKIGKTHSPAQAEILFEKLRVYTISDQDDSAAWIRKEFPSIFYIVSPGGYGNGVWTGINMVVGGIDNETISNAWIGKHIQQGHGPLGAAYPDVAYGMEGDTPAFLGLIHNGLNNLEKPNWGSWGGRYELYTPKYEDLDPKGFTGRVPVEEETRPIWTNAVDEYFPIEKGEYGRSLRMAKESFSGDKVTLWRWRDDFQNDFAARIDWCLSSYADANHPPVPVLRHDECLNIQSGQGFHLDASASYDPDGDNLSYVWFHYPEAGTFGERVKIQSAENLHTVYVQAPVVDKKETFHFILKVIDKGTPALTRYKRVIVTVAP